MKEPPVQLLRVPGRSAASPTSNGPEPVVSRGGSRLILLLRHQQGKLAGAQPESPSGTALGPGKGGEGHVEKAYERRDEAKQKIQQQGDSSQSPDTGPTGGITDRPEGSTTVGVEERLSARPLRRED